MVKVISLRCTNESNGGVKIKNNKKLTMEKVITFKVIIRKSSDIFTTILVQPLRQLCCSFFSLVKNN